MLDLPLEAQRLGWQAFDAVAPASRQSILRELTLALLADLPDDLARNPRPLGRRESSRSMSTHVLLC